MHRNDLPAWTAKTKRTNTGIILQVGMRVRTFAGQNGTIHDITLPDVMPGSIEDHGTVAVQHDDGTIWHFTYTAWQHQLRVLPPKDCDTDTL